MKKQECDTKYWNHKSLFTYSIDLRGIYTNKTPNFKLCFNSHDESLQSQPLLCARQQALFYSFVGPLQCSNSLQQIVVAYRLFLQSKVNQYLVHIIVEAIAWRRKENVNPQFYENMNIFDKSKLLFLILTWMPNC